MSGKFSHKIRKTVYIAHCYFLFIASWDNNYALGHICQEVHLEIYFIMAPIKEIEILKRQDFIMG